MTAPFTPGPLQTRWLAALESGKWKQCQGTLHNFKGHCCLGVADEACNLEERDSATLQETYQALGLRDNVGSFVRCITIDGDTWGDFTQLNDDALLSFPQIAALIRADPANFFTEPR